MKIIIFVYYRVLLFVFALPVMQVVLFCLAIGKDPTDLKMAIVNHEIPIGNSSCPVLDGCNLSLLSCRYLSFLNSDLIEKVRLLVFKNDSDSNIQLLKTIIKNIYILALLFGS